MSDLMAGLEYLRDGVRIALGSQTGDEERRRQAILGQKRQDTADAYPGTERLVRHDHRVIGIAAADSQNGQLRVDIERQDRERALRCLGGHSPFLGFIAVRGQVGTFVGWAARRFMPMSSRMHFMYSAFMCGSCRRASASQGSR